MLAYYVRFSPIAERHWRRVSYVHILSPPLREVQSDRRKALETPGAGRVPR